MGHLIIMHILRKSTCETKTSQPKLVLLWGGMGGQIENQPIQPGDHKPPNISTPGIKLRTKC